MRARTRWFVVAALVGVIAALLGILLADGGNRAATRPDHPDPALRTRFYVAEVDAALAACAVFANTTERWALVFLDKDEGRAHLTHTTAFWGFVDDVRVTVAREDNRTRLDAESESRVGSYDFGQNGRNLRELLGALDARLGSEP